ncbi:MAG: TRAP transporter fused permease subunit [Pseudomonadales bacterium]|nr:TRAP transporter fused permease subunit [Pseudomonadales bacterium]MCP5329758.1 TRAP transporter fused permease subunit [Pseudomonadales bacterium]
MKSPLLRWGAFLFALFHVYTNLFASLSELWFAAIHFGGFCALCALSANERLRADVPRAKLQHALNILFAILAIGVPVYLVLFENALYAREAEFIWSDYLVSAIAVMLAIEFTRRTTGWFTPVLILVSLAYILFLGRYISGVFSFPGLSLETVLYRSFFSAEGMFGSTANISATYVFMFILFGAFLLKSGAGEFIVRLARCLAGRYTGGAALVSVVGSGLMGSVSGSAVANTVSTGVITIPMMKRSGFPPQFAAGVEAAASTGGALMPPIMGAGAFVMAGYTQIPYTQIVAVSILPALLYFLTVAFFVRIEAKRLGLLPENIEQTETLRNVLKEGWHFSLPLAVLIGALLMGYTALLAAVFAIAATIAASWISPRPMSLQDCFDATVDGVRNMTATALLLVAVGLVINVVTTTGIGNAFSLMIVEWAQGNLLITIALVALASLILGMGLPVTASYIVLATLSAPVIYDLIAQDYLLQALQSADLPSSVRATLSLFGGDPVVALREMPLEMRQLLRAELLDPTVLAGMLLSAHLIIFWLSQDSNITPPVCLAAFAAAGIAGTRPMATGMTSWKLAKGLYLIPVLFAYSPLISGTWPERLSEFGWSCLGLYALAGLLQWRLDRPLNPLSAAMLLSAAALLMWAPLGIPYHLAGAGLLFAVVLWQKRTPA